MQVTAAFPIGSIIAWDYHRLCEFKILSLSFWFCIAKGGTGRTMLLFWALLHLDLGMLNQLGQVWGKFHLLW